MRPEIRNLALHPDVAILALEIRAHRRHQIAHRPHAPLWRLELQPELIRLCGTTDLGCQPGVARRLRDAEQL
jgi:hypothetical protein